MIKISLKCVAKCLIVNKSTLVQAMAWHWTGDNPWAEPIFTKFYDAIWYCWASISWFINTFRQRQNGRHFADDTFKCIFFNENVGISIKISLNFVPKGLINNIPALVQIMAWCLISTKPLSEPVLVSLLTHICITQHQWINWRILCKRAKFWYRWVSARKT